MYVGICFIGFMCWWDFIFEFLGIPLLLGSIVIYTSRSECEPFDLYEKGERPLLRNYWIFALFIFSFIYDITSIYSLMWVEQYSYFFLFSFHFLYFITSLYFSIFDLFLLFFIPLNVGFGFSIPILSVFLFLMFEMFIPLSSLFYVRHP